MFDIVFWMADL